jgi:hypothetical protein
MEEIEIILTDEEFEWIDIGNGFCSLDNLEKEDYDDISWFIIKKLRAVYTEGELRNNNRNTLKLTQEEIDYLEKVLTELIYEDYYTITVLYPKVELPERSRQDEIMDFEKKTVSLNNEILKKLGKSPLTIEEIKKKSEQLHRDRPK